jgi:hypothetical protein
MSIRQHCVLMFSSHTILLFGGVATGYFVHASADRTGFLLGLGFVGVLIANQLLFQFVIPAHCPKCGDRVELKKLGTHQYHCPSCEHVHDTGISSEPIDVV